MKQDKPDNALWISAHFKDALYIYMDVLYTFLFVKIFVVQKGVSGREKGIKVTKLN